ncbi:hypothetical protein JB92DRAFT_3092962 [Gautieria morchelliformis]|nr:hypothetical protein JB92DRAFT_3092962 [Gautieria morchelliformis]
MEGYVIGDGFRISSVPNYAKNNALQVVKNRYTSCLAPSIVQVVESTVEIMWCDADDDVEKECGIAVATNYLLNDRHSLLVTRVELSVWSIRMLTHALRSNNISTDIPDGLTGSVLTASLVQLHKVRQMVETTRENFIWRENSRERSYSLLSQDPAPAHGRRQNLAEFPDALYGKQGRRGPSDQSRSAFPPPSTAVPVGGWMTNESIPSSSLKLHQAALTSDIAGFMTQQMASSIEPTLVWKLEAAFPLRHTWLSHILACSESAYVLLITPVPAPDIIPVVFSADRRTLETPMSLIRGHEAVLPWPSIYNTHNSFCPDGKDYGNLENLPLPASAYMPKLQDPKPFLITFEYV